MTLIYEYLSETERLAIPIGICGPNRFGWLIKLIPQGGQSVHCGRHDFFYWVGGTEKDRKNADKDWENRMLNGKGNRCVAIFYSKLVQRFGSRFFHYGPKRDREELGKLVDAMDK